MVDTTVSDDSLIDSEIDLGEVFGSLGGAKTFQDGLQTTLDASGRREDGPQMAPGWLLDGPKMAVRHQRYPKMVQDGPI